MGFIATDIAKIPSVGYEWYLYLLTDNWDDPIQEALLKNFDQLSQSVGTSCLVVKGANPEQFYNSLIDSQFVELIRTTGEELFPSLVLSSHPPSKLNESSGKGANIKGAVSFLIPLRMKADLHSFLRKLSETIKSGDPMELFENDPVSKWAWMTEYLEVKPNICGVGINLNPLFDKLFRKV